jgi:hypothetical protein
MGIQYSAAVVNAKLDAIESTIGTSAVLKIRTGAAPSDLTGADSGTVLSTLSLPSDWMAAASAGSKAKSGTWQDTSADATGTAGHFRVYASDGSTKHIQGSVGTSDADMIVDSTSFTAGQSFTINSFTITSGNYP